MQQAFDRIARVVAERRTRRAALFQLSAIASAFARFIVDIPKATAQALPSGSTCSDDADCTESEICSIFDNPPMTRHYCCRPPSSSCTTEDDCCAGLRCIGNTCQTGVPLPVAANSGEYALQDTGCTFVELYPGYPGYRGFVTGLVGPGEAACLEQLQRQFPWFDRDREDRENAAAAARLGLAGGPKDWIWENWMDIEAERGLPVTCYTCAADKIAAGEPYQAAPADPTDVRLLVGSFGSNELVFRIAAAHGVEMWEMERLAETDYQLRAVAWTANAPRHMNALELQSTYDALGELASEGQLPGWRVWGTAIEQGGYAPTPAGAAFADQVFLIGTAFEAQNQTQTNQIIANGVSQVFNTVVSEWASEYARGSTQGLGEFIQENNPLLATY